MREIALPLATDPPIKLQRFVWTRSAEGRRSFDLTYSIASAASTAADFVLHVRGTLEVGRQAVLRMNNTLCDARADRETHDIAQTLSLPAYPNASEKIEPMINVSRPLAQRYIAWLRAAGVQAPSENLVPRINLVIIALPPSLNAVVVTVDDSPVEGVVFRIEF